MGTYFYVKRIFDFIIALISIIVLLPVFILVSFLVKLESKGPVFFKQRRIGIHQKEFVLIKFRTMRIDTPNNIPTHLMKDYNQYITRVGKTLRKLSLDELPQLINILRGEMSFIGPRPALYNQTDLVIEREKFNAHSVFPGITGWAQVNGRDSISISDKARLDGAYVNNFGLKMDALIWLRTVKVVLTVAGFVEGGPKVNDSKDAPNKK